MHLVKKTAKYVADRLGLTPDARIAGIAHQNGYRILKELQYRRVFLLERGTNRAILKCVNHNGLVAARDVLPAITHRFDRLVIPRVLAIGQANALGDWVILDWHEGREYAREWDPFTPALIGGRAIPLETVHQVIDLILDLRRIDATAFERTGIERRTKDWLEGRLHEQLNRALTSNQISTIQQQRCWDLLGGFLACVDSGELGLSNNDFQFRNFVELPNGRIKVIDWDVARLSTYETEHCIAYIWMHMWGNVEWRRAFLSAVRTRLSPCPACLRAAFIIVTLNHAIYAWGNIPALSTIHLNTFLKLLDDEEWGAIWSQGSGIVEPTQSQHASERTWAASAPPGARSTI
jgi:aminoglycoside phosphotransferase (APT) family kinase protein